MSSSYADCAGPPFGLATANDFFFSFLVSLLFTHLITMIQSDIIVRKATLDDIKYAKEASTVVNQAYRSKGMY